MVRWVREHRVMQKVCARAQKKYAVSDGVESTAQKKRESNLKKLDTLQINNDDTPCKVEDFNDESDKLPDKSLSAF